jgi:hypothetical protein
MSSNSPLTVEESASDATEPTASRAEEVPELDVEDEEEVELTPDMIFEVLKNERRRRVLDYLEGRENPMKLGDLAEAIAAQENDKTVDALTSSERKRVYVGLYQCHLPKMDDMEIVDFNRNRGLVELSENAEYLDPYLEKGAEVQRPWYVYYAAIASGGAALFAAGLAGAIPLQQTVGITLGVVLAALFACSVLHAYTVGGEPAD